MATCDPQELLASAACIDCLSPGLKETLKLQLLCEIANGAGDGGITELTGDVTAGPGTGSVAATIAAGAVTLAKMANLAANSVIGNSTGLSATPQALSAGSVGLAVLATTTQAAARAAIGAGTGSGTVTDVSVTTANGVSGSVATSTTTPAITLTLGAITPTSAAFSGTAGAGFVSLLTQSSDPAAPASGFTQFADSTGRFSWIRQSDGFKRTLDATLTANRVYTLPDATTTIAGLNVAQTFTLANTFQAQTTIQTGTAANPSINFTGTSSGFWNRGAGVVGISVNGSDVYSFGASTFAIISPSALVSFNGDALISRKAAANLQLGSFDAAAPVAQTLSVQSVVAGTTDTAGSNWTFNASRGTGTGAGGNILFQVALPGSTGSTQNSLTTALQLRGDSAGLLIGSAGSGASAYLYPFSGSASSASHSGRGLAFYNYSNTAGDTAFRFSGNSMTQTSGTQIGLALERTFAPTSGTGVYNHLTLTPTINQTGGANGITRGLYINPTLTAAADFRALEIADGNVVLPKTVTAGGTTGAQTINKVTGSVNFAAAATSLVVTNSYVTTSSIIIATVATNDTTMKSVAVVAGSGSFTIHANAAATAETRVNFIVTN